ncbi:NMDA receptor synaptonuclear signaling and neuronal migration factor isoform X5 [Mauremys reevesii]|uniref:NMDA receptor synaptonuclear signaling and neuronal migration factor isoform X5 n=1 Tax=Mauremys reevesii TaxID=260615 RepID=UPI00193FFA56|nr:NMDA receptor synaptonuclear signaling and neuronal migration factor isoform X5 [Mauremys reevesii]
MLSAHGSATGGIKQQIGAYCWTSGRLFVIASSPQRYGQRFCAMNAASKAFLPANMGTAVSRRKTLRNDAISSVAAKVRAAKAFGEYLSQNHPEGRNGSDDVPIRTWFPKENLFSFQTATTTMQAISAFRGYAERKRRKRENDSAAVIQRNFRKHLRMVGSRRVKAQPFGERRERSFSRSWSDPTPIKADSFHDSRESHDLQDYCYALDDDFDLNWETEKELEAMACDGDDFIPPKIMLISSKVPKAEYIPTIIRRDDPSIIPILYDHEHATFEDILEEIEKKLNIYQKGCKIWKMLIFCQGGPGHLYLLKNKVATFAKVEKEEDMILFWKRLSRLMSKINPEPNVIHIMGCYILGNPNGEKLFQNLKNLMNPYRVVFESPLELSAQGKQMIETYFDFRLYRLWKTRQHSKLLDYDDIL